MVYSIREISCVERGRRSKQDQGMSDWPIILNDSKVSETDKAMHGKLCYNIIQIPALLGGIAGIGNYSGRKDQECS